MKKVIIGISTLIVLTFIIIFAVNVNAQNGNQQDKSKISQVVTCCASITQCCNPEDSNMTENSTMKCDPAKCKGGKCNPATCKEEKCDPATCKGNNCDPATCKINCGGATLTMKFGPMNCNR